MRSAVVRQPSTVSRSHGRLPNIFMIRRTIRRSNNAYRTSLQDLGLVIANHALSTVDAFITVRLRRHVDAAGERLELRGSIPFEP